MVKSDAESVCLHLLILTGLLSSQEMSEIREK